MQNTSNYNLNLVEGTDLVNPPIQFNPNFQTIDAAMFANKEKTVGTASEVVTGTVHAIVRANQDADTFRFTATGAWTTGDTMTVDGTSVTVHLSDGTAPLTGAYVIGAEVLAVLNGTLVTLITSSAAIDPGVTSFNSRTGAVSPTASDYDASMIDYDNTTSGLTATDVQAALDEIQDEIDNLPSGGGSVSVTITSSTTWKNALNSLSLAADPTMLTEHSLIEVGGHYYRRNSNNYYSEAYVGSLQYVCTTLVLDNANSANYFFGSTAGRSDKSNDGVGYNGSMTLYY